MVSDILRLPLRAVVASSSATRSSRSAQQSPPRSAALADGIATPPMNNPAAATSASRLDVFDSPPSLECVSTSQMLRSKSNRFGRQIIYCRFASFGLHKSHRLLLSDA